MKKYLKYILIFMLAFVMGNISVKAAYTDAAQCKTATKCKSECQIVSKGNRTNNICDPKTYGSGGILARQCLINPNDGKYYVWITPYEYACLDNWNEEPEIYDPEDIGTDIDRPTGGSSSETSLPSINPSTTSCSDLFAGVGDQIKEIFKAIKIAVPILVIVLSSLDFAKAIFGGDDGETKKAQSKFIKRLVVALIFFLLPTFMNFMMGVINGVYNGSWDCMILE